MDEYWIKRVINCDPPDGLAGSELQMKAACTGAVAP